MFPYGQCTYYLASKKHITWNGNAGEWLINSSYQGYTTGSTPQVGAIMVTNESPYGHVALVEKIRGREIIISEMNYKGVGIVSNRILIIGSSVIKGYIY